MIQYPLPILTANATATQRRAAVARPHPDAGFWRSLPLALALSAGWWAVGLTAVAVLSHYR